MSNELIAGVIAYFACAFLFVGFSMTLLEGQKEYDRVTWTLIFLFWPVVVLVAVGGLLAGIVRK